VFAGTFSVEPFAVSTTAPDEFVTLHTYFSDDVNEKFEHVPLKTPYDADAATCSADDSSRLLTFRFALVVTVPTTAFAVQPQLARLAAHVLSGHAYLHGLPTAVTFTAHTLV